MGKKLTEKQKIRLWEQLRGRSFEASCRLDVLEPHAQDELFAKRAAAIELGPLHRGLPWLCSIHQQLFQDAYDWAGELREVDISRGDTRFCHFEYIENEGNDLMQELEDEHYLAELPKAEFIERLAHYYCEINVLHPFFVGSGRAQRVFFEQLAIHAGYVLDWSVVDPQAWQAANQAGALGDLAPLIEIFTKVVSEARESE
ncbi:putative adenosine monophosphate-protein transferase Fic [Dryocola sp. BD626]|uniref:putative adenosine monophosphate-protein transferase Fic n=1 Tax=Dryocola sp. BD626 TaxID=3133273 RepID=UPI003F4F847F